jgi:hypothetical protein
MAISVGTHRKTDDKIDKWVVAQAKHPFNSQGFLRFLVQVSLASQPLRRCRRFYSGGGRSLQGSDQDQPRAGLPKTWQDIEKSADAPLPRCFPFSFDVNIVYSGSRPKVLSAGNLRCLLVVVEVTFGFKHRQNIKRCLNDAELPC